MANTLIIGDIAEGSKWFGQVEFLKQQLLMTYKTSNRSMHTWKALSSDVSAFVELRNGEPYAFIYVGEQGDYEFFAPETVGDYVTALGQVAFNGTKFYKDKPEVMRDDGSFPELVLRNEYPSFPVNTWYSEDCWVTGGIGVRYARLAGGGLMGELLDYPAKIYNKVEGGTATSIFSSPEPVNAASMKGNYCFAISSMGVAYAWDITTGALLDSFDIIIDAPADNVEDLTVKGFWAFNRAGDRACTHIVVQQFGRFGVGPGSGLYNVDLSNFFTTYVVEIGFTTDAQGAFSGIELYQTIETDNFVVAADYNWTIESNPLIIAEVTTFDYALAIAIPFTPHTRYEVGDVIKITRAQGSVERILYMALVTSLSNQVLSDGSIGGYGVSGGTMTSAYNQSTSGGVHYYMFNRGAAGDSVVDCWLNIREPNGEILKTIELQHNSSDYTSYFNWHGSAYPNLDLRNSGYGFIMVVSGLDIRILGATVYQYGNASPAWATVYDVETEVPLASSGNKPRFACNSYDAFSVHRKIWTFNARQTIAAIPYLRTGTDSEGREITYPIKECAVYATTNAAGGVVDFARVVDFMIDKNGTEKTSYHANTYEKAGTGVVPYKHCTSGGWAKKKDRP